MRDSWYYRSDEIISPAWEPSCWSLRDISWPAPLSSAARARLDSRWLIAPEKRFDNQSRLQLEPKADIKKRLGFSPDLGDALALTFAELDYPDSLRNDQNVFVDSNVYVTFDNNNVDSNFYYD